MILRLLKMSDANKLLKWKNYPETRKFSILSHDKIEKEDHYEWLEKNLHGFNAIEVGGSLAGAIRLNNREVSVWIDREYRGKGLAVWAIENVSYPGCFAKIVDGNIPSFRVFIDAGFKPIQRKDNYYILQK